VSTRISEIVGLLPHDGPARMIDTIVDVDDEQITCTGQIPRESPFVKNCQARSLVLIELSAQAAALLELAVARHQGQATRGSVGYLVRLRRVEFSAPLVDVGRTMTVHVKRIGAASPLYQYEAHVVADGQQLFAGLISTYVERADDSPSNPFQSRLKQNH